MANELRGGDAEDEGKNLEFVSTVLAEISAIKPDMVCLPEVFAFLWKKEKTRGAGREFMREASRKYGIYLAGSVHEERDDRLYNTALLFDPGGEIAGRYDKVHPTEGELEFGISPGAPGQAPAETRFGKVGLRICFDANWHKDWEELADTGARLVLFLSAFPGGRILEALAILNHVHVAASIWTLHSGVIDNTGRWLARSSKEKSWAWADVELERSVFHLDFQEGKLEAVGKRYGAGLKIEIHRPEGWFVLEPVSPSVSIGDVIREFGLVTFRDYMKRATKAQLKAAGRAED